VFGDGHECFFANNDLRRECPCATCRDYRDRGQDAWPRPDSPPEARIENAELVGGWGISFAWNDGHATGIFPFEGLRSWCERMATDTADSS
jgi:ATP-binding protein involved in chromosome partitioning